MKSMFLCMIGLHGCLGVENQVNHISETEVPGQTQDTAWYPDAYDVVVVMDTSCSMSDDTIIHFGLTKIPEELTALQVDYQMTVTNADPNPQFFDYLHITPDAPDADWEIMEALNTLLTARAPGEAGLDALWAFENTNPGWFRPGATTLVVFVSDEDDQSVSTPTELLTQWPRDIEIVSVTGLPIEQRPTDPAYRCSAAAGDRYIEVSDRIQDICVGGQWTIF